MPVNLSNSNHTCSAPCSPPLTQTDPSGVSPTIHQLRPRDLCAAPPPKKKNPRPISINPDSLGLSLLAPCSLAEFITPPQAPITTLHIQVINEAAPVCAARSKVSLTFLMGLRGQTEVTGTLLSFVSELCFLLLALPLQVFATRGRQRLT